MNVFIFILLILCGVLAVYEVLTLVLKVIRKRKERKALDDDQEDTPEK